MNPQPKIHPACIPIEKLLGQCDVKRTRGSGPGGQHRNKVETAIVVTHRESGVVGQASEKRSQERNRLAAIQRLRVNLAVEVRGPFDATVGPSALWLGRLKHKKVVVSIEHEDYPALLSEALDCLCDQDFDIAAAAKSLMTSTSQLVKFFKIEPLVFQWVNQQRRQRELGPLK